MKRSEAMTKQCRVAGFILAPTPAPPVLKVNGASQQVLPTFLTCGAEICCHWIDESDPGAPVEERAGRCGVGGA